MSNDRQPLYLQIQNHFKRSITEGLLKEGDQIPTEQELMKIFSVSRITVANAITQLAKQGWVYRIPGKGTFVGKIAEKKPDESAAAEAGSDKAPDGAEEVPAFAERPPAPSPPTRRMIGFVIPSVSDFFALRLIRGINSVLDGTSYCLNIVLTNHSKAREKEAIAELVRFGAAGLIIFPVDAEAYNEEILTLKVNRFPFVLVDRYMPGVATHFVCSDSRKGAQLAVSHLWAHGHRSIAICSNSPIQTITVQERLAGYMDALKLKGSLINPELILTGSKMGGGGAGEEGRSLRRFIASRLATAYIALNSTLGTQIAGIARGLGLDIPEDLSIVTFDDPSPGLDGQANFTHIAQSEEEIGRQAMRILLDALRLGSGADDFREIILEPQLVVGATSGPCPRRRG
ncbi:GntR family transcriptional regulator [Cohnella hongkongensis]|uniref:GntR family transcriptional regulator n=1 Tax=Cohnella hongkongensis TaxID=178337 RepID=A0ABV9FC87_9BACL